MMWRSNKSNGPTEGFHTKMEMMSRRAFGFKNWLFIIKGGHEDQDIIDKILAHLRNKEQDTPTLPHLVPPTRAPPETLPLFAGKDSSTTALHQQGSQ